MDVTTTLTAAGLKEEDYDRVIAAALAEDLADGGDVTTLATVPADAMARADFTARQHGVAAGVPVAIRVLRVHGGSIGVTAHVRDGDLVAPGTVLFTATGPARALLTAERTALNMLCHLSGIATATRRWVDAVAGTGAAIRDTRKTTPGLRALEKYAVRCGGGVNHRMCLSDAALVKDNHVVAAGGVAAAFRAVRERYPSLPVEVEVDTLDQLREVLDAGADLILLDNFTPELMREAVKIVGGRAAEAERQRATTATGHRESDARQRIGRAKLEASGRLTLEAARVVAETGVDYLSVGALTHSAPILDIGCDFSDSERSGDAAGD